MNRALAGMLVYEIVGHVWVATRVVALNGLVFRNLGILVGLSAIAYWRWPRARSRYVVVLFAAALGLRAIGHPWSAAQIFGSVAAPAAALYFIWFGKRRGSVLGGFVAAMSLKDYVKLFLARPQLDTFNGYGMLQIGVYGGLLLLSACSAAIHLIWKRPPIPPDPQPKG